MTQQPISTHPEYALWLAALAQEPRSPVIVYTKQGCVLEVNGAPLVTAASYEQLVKGLKEGTEE